MAERVKDQVGASRVVVYDQVTPNPELDQLDEATAALKKHDICTIVALGGGSVIDTAKALAVCLPTDLDFPLADTLRKKNLRPWKSGLPVIAIPTTAGTGSEVTPFATIWDRKELRKHSLAGDFVYPAHAVLDPELTMTLPPQQTLFTALDAISHALESLWNKNRSPVSEAYAVKALHLACEALPVILDSPDDLRQRARMQESSLLAGLAISQTRTAVAHAISYPLTLHYDVPHGLACGFLLPALIKYVLSDESCAEKDLPTRDAMKKTGTVLDGLNLEGCLLDYLTVDELRSLTDKIDYHGRADNFVCDDVPLFVRGLLEEYFETLSVPAS